MTNKLRIIDLTKNALILEADSSFEAKKWQASLGGTIKIGEVVEEFKTLKELISSLTTDYLINKFTNKSDKKIIFGFSLYGDTLWRYHAELNTLGLRLKKELLKKHHKGRFISAQDGVLTSVQVTKNKMIAKGADILVISGLYSFYLCKTVAVQDFEEYSERDYGRPQRDAHSGMLPPKLTQIMLNLAQGDSQKKLLDPFCGSGTVLQEAALMGYKNITGSDISEKAINDTKENLKWLAGKYKLNNIKSKLILSDIKKLPEKIPTNSIDIVVTEPYLGPLIRKNISVISMLAIIQELESLYLASFNSLAKMVKQNSRLVIVFPLFKTDHGIYSLKILEQLGKIGFNRINPIQEKISLFAKVGPTARGSLVYQRPDQKVEREIFIFKYHKKTEAD